MRLLFPTDSLRRSQVETDYELEYRAAQEAGFSVGLFDFDALTRGESAAQIARLLPRDGRGETTLARSWMMRAEDYARWETLLRERNFAPLTSARAYQSAHHFPDSYPFLQGHTPRSLIIPREQFERENGLDFTPIRAALQTFGAAPIVVKDWVKSQKHAWNEACFIPRADDFSHAERVIRRFLELQGERLVGGVVLREFLHLKSVGTHPQSGLPLTAEWRVFVFNGEPFFVAPYWAVADYGSLQLDLDFVRERAKAIPCRFFSLDVAQTVGGAWQVIEIGDGQVSGLPSLEVATDFYKALRGISEWIR